MISMDKEYRTREGNPVKIYATDHDSTYPVVGAIIYEDGSIHTCTWTKDGDERIESEAINDLIEVKPRIKMTRWVNISKCKTIGGVYNSRESADYSASCSRIACIPIDIDCEHGEGLDEENT